jgi:hypothetical protein
MRASHLAPILRAMQAAAHPGHDTGSRWRVSRNGDAVATVAVRHEGGDVVVAADLGGRTCPHRFPSLRAAEAFVADLIASFSYLGCEVARD